MCWPQWAVVWKAVGGRSSRTPSSGVGELRPALCGSTVTLPELRTGRGAGMSSAELIVEEDSEEGAPVGGSRAPPNDPALPAR